MRITNQPAFIGVSIAVSILAVGALVAFGHTFIHAAISTDRPSDWLGFWGALIGAAATIAAGGLAWFATQRQFAFQQISFRLTLLVQEREKISRELPSVIEMNRLARRLRWPCTASGAENKVTGIRWALDSYYGIERSAEVIDIRKLLEERLNGAPIIMLDRLIDCLLNVESTIEKSPAILRGLGLTDKEKKQLLDQDREDATKQVIAVVAEIETLLNRYLETLNVAEAQIRQMIASGADMHSHTSAPH